MTSPAPSIQAQVSQLADARPKMLGGFWRFARERQNIFERRLQRQQPPWTTDPVFSVHKFTNCYRAADRVSQYLLKEVQYNPALNDGAEDVLFRTTLFRLFNQPSTWTRMWRYLGECPGLGNFTFARYSGMMATLMAERSEPPVYNAAYILPASRVHGYPAKHDNLLKTLEIMVNTGTLKSVLAATSLKQVYRTIHGFPLIGDFIGYQLTIDYNYTEHVNHDENSFVVAGPGAKRGLQKTFTNLGGAGVVETIRHLTQYQDYYLTKLGLNPIRLGGLGGRRLHLIDVQNLMCEWDKMCRAIHPELSAEVGVPGTQIKQKYDPRKAKKPIDYFFPPKWGLASYFNLYHGRPTA